MSTQTLCPVALTWALPFPLSGTEETGPLKNAGSLQCTLALGPGTGRLFTPCLRERLTF